MFSKLTGQLGTWFSPASSTATAGPASRGVVPWDTLELLDNRIVTDREGNLKYFAAEVVEQDAGQLRHVHKIVTLQELAFIPVESRKDPDFLGKMHTVLRGCYNAEIDIMHIIAGMFDTEPPLGIMQFYGVVGVATDEKEALRRALLGTEGLIHTMANFPQIAFRPLDIYRTQWLRDAMYAMPYALTIIGQPDPRNAARGGGRNTSQGMGETTGAVDGEITSQQNEMLMRAMADARQSFLMITLASQVKRSELAILLEGLARRASLVASQQRGTRGISFNLGIPIFLSGGISDGAAMSHSAAHSHGVSNAVGTATGHAHTTSTSHFTADSQSQGVAQTQGTAVSHGSFSSSTSGIAVANSTSVGHAHSAGSSWGTAHTAGVADTTSVAHTAGHSVSTSHTSGTSVVSSSSTGQSSGVSQTSSSGTSTGVSLGHSTNQGTSTTGGHATTVSTGQSMSASQGTSTGTTVSHGLEHGSSTGVSAGLHTESHVGGGASGSIGIASVNASGGISGGWSVSANHSWNHASSSSQGASAGSSHSMSVGSSSGLSASTSGSHTTTSGSGSSMALNVGTSTGAASSTSSGQSSSQGASIAQTSSTSVSSGSFSSTTHGRAHTVSSADTTSHGGSTANTDSTGAGHGVTVIHSHSAGSSSAVTQSVATTHSRSISHSEGTGTGTANSTSTSRSRSHSVGDSTSLVRGRSLSMSNSTSVMAGLAPGVSVSKSFAFEDDVMAQLTLILRQQEELVRQMSLEGGYITDVYVLTKTPEGQQVVETAVPQAFHGLNEVVTPVQTRKLGQAEQDHIREHIASWTPCSMEESVLDGVNAYRHGTLLTMGQLSAYVAPGLFEEGTATTTMEKIPVLGFYPQQKGEVVLGHQISPETRKVTKASLRLSKERMFHTLFAADTGFGKSIAAERLALETTVQWHYRTIILDFGAGWRDMIHAPGLTADHLDIWQLYPGASRPLRWNPLQIGRRIDPDQQFRITPELLANAGRMGPRQLGFMQETLSTLYRDRGVLTTDMRVQDDRHWGHVRDRDEEEAINARRRERGQADESFVNRALETLSADELQSLAIHRSKKVDIIDWYEQLLVLEKELKGRQTDLTSLEGIKVRLKPFTYGNMARMYRKGADTIAIEDVGLPWGMCIFEGGAQLDAYAKSALLSLMAWHLYTDAVSRERQGDFYKMQIFFEEANKVLTGIGSGTGNEGSPMQSVSEQFETMWRDGRKYGIFLHPIVQTPSDLPPGIISSCNNVLFGQLKNPRDRDLAVAHLSFSEKGFTDEDYRRWITRTEIGRATVRFGYTTEYGEMMPTYAEILKVPTRKATNADIAEYFT